FPSGSERHRGAPERKYACRHDQERSKAEIPQTKPVGSSPKKKAGCKKIAASVREQKKLISQRFGYLKVHYCSTINSKHHVNPIRGCRSRFYRRNHRRDH